MSPTILDQCQLSGDDFRASNGACGSRPCDNASWMSIARHVDVTSALRRASAHSGPLFAAIDLWYLQGVRGAVFDTQEGSRPRQLHRLHRLRDAEHTHHAFEVVSQHMKAHFGAHASDRLGQEVRRTHPVLDGSERVLDRLPSLSHPLGLTIESSLHRIDHVFVLPAPHASV